MILLAGDVRPNDLVLDRICPFYGNEITPCGSWCPHFADYDAAREISMPVKVGDKFVLKTNLSICHGKGVFAEIDTAEVADILGVRPQFDALDLLRAGTHEICSHCKGTGINPDHAWESVHDSCEVCGGIGAASKTDKETK